MGYIQEYKRRYLKADRKTRKASREHWLRIYRETGDELATQILAVIASIEL